MDEICISFLKVDQSDNQALIFIFDLNSILIIFIFEQNNLSIKRTFLIFSIGLFLIDRLSPIWFYIEMFLLLSTLFLECWWLLSSSDHNLLLWRGDGWVWDIERLCVFSIMFTFFLDEFIHLHYLCCHILVFDVTEQNCFLENGYLLTKIGLVHF